MRSRAIWTQWHLWCIRRMRTIRNYPNLMKKSKRLSINASKSIRTDRVRFRKHAVTVRCILCPDPAAADVVVSEVWPETKLSTFGLGPIPGLLDFDQRSVHVVHVVAVIEGSEFCIDSEGTFAVVITCSVAINFETSDGIGEDNDSSSPSVVFTVISNIEGGKCGSVTIKGSVQQFGMKDTGDGDFDSAGRVSLLGIAPITFHLADPTIFLFRPYSSLEGETLLDGGSGSVVREVFLSM